jgi:hypothetical protein
MLWAMKRFASARPATRPTEPFFKLLNRQQSLKQKILAWDSGGPTGGRRVAVCLGRWRSSPCAAYHAANDNIFLVTSQIRPGCYEAAGLIISPLIQLKTVL